MPWRERFSGRPDELVKVLSSYVTSASYIQAPGAWSGSKAMVYKSMIRDLHAIQANLSFKPKSMLAAHEILFDTMHHGWRLPP